MAKWNWWLPLFSLWQLSSGSCSVGTARSTICACTSGHFAPPASVIALKPWVVPSEHSTPGAAPLGTIRLSSGHSQGRRLVTSTGCQGALSQQCQGEGRAWPQWGQWQCHLQPR